MKNRTEYKKEFNTEAETNPVSETAVVTLVQLAEAGYEKSGEMLKRLGIRTEDYAWCIGGGDPLVKTCMVANRESRYVALNNAALESGCEIVFDLPCGLIHRLFDMASEKRIYVGGDLPEIISRMKSIVREMPGYDEKDGFRFAEADVTNLRSLQEALAGYAGETAVLTEGLFVYLSDRDREKFMKNVHCLLRERGGCWITPDPETIARHLAVYSAIAGGKAPEILMQEMRGLSGESGQNIIRTNLRYLNKDGAEEEEKTYQALEQEFIRNGFRVEKIPFTRGNYALRSFKMLSEEKVQKLKEALSHIHLWKMTPDPEFVSEEKAKTNLQFCLDAEVKGDALSVSLAGNLDSLSAPALLEAWERENASETIRRVFIDCRHLGYISSAGMHVLSMIQDAAGAGNPVFLHAGKAVREILDSSGNAWTYGKEAMDTDCAVSRGPE